MPPAAAYHCLHDNAGSQSLNTPLHYAARNGKLEVVTLLLDRGAEKEAKDEVRLSSPNQTVEAHSAVARRARSTAQRRCI